MLSFEKLGIKKQIIGFLAIASFVFGIVGVVFGAVSLKLLGAHFSSLSIAGILLSSVFPALALVYFTALCCKVNEKNIALTGIPVIAIGLFGIINTVRVIVIQVNGGAYNDSALSVIGRNVSSLLKDAFIILFAVFFILTLKEKFYDDAFGKALTIIVALICIFVGFYEDLSDLDREYYLFSISVGQPSGSINIKDSVAATMAQVFCQALSSLFMYSAMLYPIIMFRKKHSYTEKND